MQAEIDVRRKKIAILGLGGTIAGRSSHPGDNLGYSAGEIAVTDLLQSLPASDLVSFDVVSVQVAQLDSKDMDFSVWRRLLLVVGQHLAQADVDAVVITHGTDTLEETAWFLHLALDPGLTAAKPVVLTCAMRPASSRSADGPQNLLDALAVARLPQARGVVAVCTGAIHAAADVQKVHTYRLQAFDSGDAGALGYVEEGSVRMLRAWPTPPAQRSCKAASDIAASDAWPRVEVVLNDAGADGHVVDALIEHGLRVGRSVRGIVVAGTGNGTVHVALEGALCRAQEAGVRVVRSTRCAYGRVLPLVDQVLADSAGMSPVKARIAMLLALI